MPAPLDPRSETTTFLTNVPAALLRAIDEEAKRRGTTRSALVREWIAKGLAKPKRKRGGNANA